MENRWIPVSERLPSPHSAVMVYCPERKNQFCAYYNGTQWNLFGIYNVTLWDEVTHWKPLSQYPKNTEDK